MRGRDDGAEILRQQCDRRRGKHSSEHRRPADRRDPTCERGFQLGAGPTGIPPYEDTAGVRPCFRFSSGYRPEDGCAADLFHKGRRQVFADDAANSVRSEVTPRHGGRAYRFEN